jgi:glycosyltransferase involved in cell wall biosynthesis
LQSEHAVRAALYWPRILIYRNAISDTLGFRAVRERLTPLDDWRYGLPLVEQLNRAFGAEIDRLHPDLIHAHDYMTLAIAGEAAARRRKDGQPVPWIYDAHEYVSGLSILGPKKHRPAVALEREFLPLADRVVTVSAAVAERLQADYGMAEGPVVVFNAPLRIPDGQGGAETLRTRLGIPRAGSSSRL